MSDLQCLQDSVASLQRQVRNQRRLLLATLFVVGAAILFPWPVPSSTQVLRARSLIIEDDAGRDRLVVGAPVPDPKDGHRMSPEVGLVINDTNGFERLGLGLMENGNVGIGFDAPPGAGDARNLERINIVATADGSAYIRFVDRTTFVPARLILDDKDKFYLDFLHFENGDVRARRLSFAGDVTADIMR